MPRISVAIRIRPIEDGAGQSMLQQHKAGEGSVSCNLAGTVHEFFFDRIYDQVKGTQETIFGSCASMVCLPHIPYHIARN